MFQLSVRKKQKVSSSFMEIFRKDSKVCGHNYTSCMKYIQEL